eukprot:1069086-Pyramimonas_sp.AAC.1
MQHEFGVLESYSSKLQAQENLIDQMSTGLDQLDLQHAELSAMVKSVQVQKAAPAACRPTVALADLLEDKVGGFHLDMGDLLDLGPWH